MNAEFEDLLARHLAGDLDAAGRARLLDLCRGDLEARRELARQTVTERALTWLHAGRDEKTFADEVLSRVRAESPSGNVFVQGVIHRVEQLRVAARRRSVWQAWLAPLAAVAAVVILALWLHDRPGRDGTPAVPGEDFVARLTGTKDCQWTSAPGTLTAGRHLHRGQRLELASGFVEVTFDCGARVVLQGPASFDLDSAWVATLHSGALQATVPPQAIGFRVANPAVAVTDLGTEFVMIAEPGGAAEVSVVEGAVETVAAGAHPSDAVVLREKSARRFSLAGVSEPADGRRAVTPFVRAVAFQRETETAHYIHWSFDEPSGDVMKADAPGVDAHTFDARLQAVTSDAHPEGRWQRALRFDGAMFARASLPGISTNAPRTILFWARVPESAELSDAYAMAAWRADSRKLGSRAVHIGWNRNPNEGAIGALRTDFARGFTVATTPLRDGRWHHIGLVFVPGDGPDDAVQVKQYVDGRLEGSARRAPKHGNGATVANEEAITSASDVLWLGCRLGSDGPRKERFRGELDELFVADRALTPREIMEIMTRNQPLDLSRTDL